MFDRCQLSFVDIFVLFVCGLVIGATINFISMPDEIKKKGGEYQPLKEDIIKSTELFDRVTILCFVLTTEPNHEKKAIHVKNTWGSRCNKLIFVSNVTDMELGAVKLVENDLYDDLWNKSKNALIHVYENHFNGYDWFFKADDDTFAIMDNMRYMLSAYSPDDPIHFGKKMTTYHKLGTFHGGSGYVMSKASLKKFITEALPDENKCRMLSGGAEDGYVGHCLNNVGAYPGDGRDKFLRERFLPFKPELHLFSNGIEWYWARMYYPNDEGLDCCSNYTISFHYIEREMMYFLEYLVLNFQAYGVRHVYDRMPERKNFTAVVQTLLAEAEVKSRKS